jgi:lipoyl(octanoyl) transferase
VRPAAGDAPARPCGAATADHVEIRTLGPTGYLECWRAMQAFTEARGPATPDEIWLTEHAPVYTLGLAGRRQHVHDTRGIPLIQVDRGGQVTYHGPGQLVAYLLFDLRRSRMAVRAMVRSIEAAVIDFLATAGVPAYGKPGAPGVYVSNGHGEAKIAALGLKVRNGCTYHGVAVNVAMDLAPFGAIDPCGFPGLSVTSLSAMGVHMSVGDAGDALAPRLAAHLAADAR